jgi:hypothetical protein
MRAVMAMIVLPLVGFACGGPLRGPPADFAARARTPTLVAARADAAARGACVRRGHEGAPGRGVRQGSKVALAGGNDTLVAYVADEDERAIHTIDAGAASLAFRRSTPLRGAPASLLVLDDGRVVVTLRDRNRVEVLEPNADGSLESLCGIDVASEPLAVATDERESVIAVASGWGRRLTWLAPDSLAISRSVGLRAEPRGLLLDGARAVVAHLAIGALSVVDRADVPPVEVGLELRRRAFSRTPEDHPRTTTQGFAVVATNASGARRWLVPSTSVDRGLGESTPTSGYGGASWRSPAIAYVGVVDASTLTDLPAREPSRGGRGECLLPRAAVSDGNALWVACVGIDAVVELDARAIDPMRMPLRRWAVPAGPTGLAHDGDHLYVFAEHAHALARVDRDRGAVVSLRLPRRLDTPIDEPYERGRILFHAVEDPRLSDDGRACASCHPDGRSDGVSWATPDGARQSIALIGTSADARRFGWNGDRHSIRDHVAETRRRLGGVDFEDEDEQAALFSYVRRMSAPRRQLVRDEGDAVLGQQLFSSLGCESCHPGGGSDGALHDVGSGSALERFAFATPSLRYASATAPYFHDGRYPTLDDVLISGAMGPTEHLVQHERDALKAYLETLPDSPAETAIAAVAWAHPGEEQPYVPPASRPSSFRALRDGQAPPEPIAEDVKVIDLSKLDRVETVPQPRLSSWDVPPASLPEPTVSAPELAVQHRDGHRITFRGQRLGEIRHRDFAEGVVRPSSVADPVSIAPGGARTDCGKDGRVDPLGWFAVSDHGDGALLVETGIGWFNGPSCAVVPIWRLTAVARPIADGVYAYVTYCTSCPNGERERLDVIRTTFFADLHANRSRTDDHAWRIRNDELLLGRRDVDRVEMAFEGENWSLASRLLPRRPVVETQPAGGTRALLYWLTPDQGN